MNKYTYATNNKKTNVKYNLENLIKSRHYVDIFISSKNLCIKVKSTMTFFKKNRRYFGKTNCWKTIRI